MNNLDSAIKANDIGITYINQNYYFKNSLDANVKIFFEKVFDYFHHELKHLSKVVYPNNHDDLFITIEPTWVGIFNNAVIKAFPKAATLQEFSVAFENKEYGRADLFVRMHEWEKDFLFEAKMYEENGKNNDINKLEAEYQLTLKQAAGYYEAEPQTYLKDTFLVAIYFGWIRDIETLKKVKEYKKHQDETTDFCALYHSLKSGVCVYGRIKQAPTKVERVGYETKTPKKF